MDEELSGPGSTSILLSLGTVVVNLNSAGIRDSTNTDDWLSNVLEQNLV
jgi:hypothetical protein